ncbi:unnamed protein product [Bathycoccus prasinos]
MSRAPTTHSFLPHENNERDDDSDDVYSEEDLGTMKTMELRRAAKRRKEGGVNTTTTTADDDDAIDFDRTLALGSSGWLFIYYVGVIKVLRREGYAENTKVIGCSGGALIGSLLFMPTVDLDALAVYAYLCATRARSSILGAFQLRYYVQGAIREFAPDNAHELCTNKLEMSITRMTLRGLKNLRLKVFETYEFFVRALLCSSNIVPLSGLPMWLKGHGLCLDGALTDIQYVSGFKRSGTFSKLHCRRKHGRKLIVVSPFYSSRADIKPSKFVPVWWCFFPPEQYKMKILFEMAQKDAKSWIKKQKKKEEEKKSSGLERARRGLTENQPITTNNRNISSPESNGGATNTTGETSDSDDDDDDGEEEVEMKDSLETLRDSSRNSSQNSLQDWYTECQEWASQTSEFAAKRAAAAKAAAEKAAKKHAETWTEFAEREKRIIKSFWFRALTSTPIKKKKKRRSTGEDEFYDANEQGGYESESSRRSSFDGFLRDNAHEAFITVGKGTIKIEKLILQLIACVIVYAECALQAAFFFVLAIVSGILRVKGNEKNWERFYTFAKPMPRLLMHSVPGIPNTKKVDERTSKILGNSCATYRVLCYLIHAPTEHFETAKVSGYETNNSSMSEGPTN